MLAAVRLKKNISTVLYQHNLPERDSDLIKSHIASVRTGVKAGKCLYSLAARMATFTHRIMDTTRLL